MIAALLVMIISIVITVWLIRRVDAQIADLERENAKLKAEKHRQTTDEVPSE